MKWDGIYFAFPSKSAEPAKLLVLVISINTLQVTFKNQEDIQNCLRCCTSGAEMVNLGLVCRKPFLDTFHCQLHAMTNYSSAWDIVTSSHRLPVFRTGIADTPRENAGAKNQYLFSYVWWENAGATCFPAWQVVLHGPQLFSLLKHRPQFWPCTMV